jgi:hypothetical protein
VFKHLPHTGERLYERPDNRLILAGAWMRPQKRDRTALLPTGSDPNINPLTRISQLNFDVAIGSVTFYEIINLDGTVKSRIFYFSPL